MEFFYNDQLTNGWRDTWLDRKTPGGPDSHLKYLCSWNVMFIKRLAWHDDDHIRLGRIWQSGTGGYKQGWAPPPSELGITFRYTGFNYHKPPAPRRHHHHHHKPPAHRRHHHHHQKQPILSIIIIIQVFWIIIFLTMNSISLCFHPLFKSSCQPFLQHAWLIRGWAGEKFAFGKYSLWTTTRKLKSFTFGKIWTKVRLLFWLPVACVWSNVGF